MVERASRRAFEEMQSMIGADEDRSDYSMSKVLVEEQLNIDSNLHFQSSS